MKSRLLSSQADEQLIVWVSIDTQHTPLHEHCSIGIRCYPKPDEPRPWFEKANIRRIRADLGNASTYTYDSPNMRALHQGIVTAEILRHLYPCTIKYTNSADTALAFLSTLQHAEKKRAITWLDAHQDVHPHEWMHAYDTLTHECGYMFPTREEIIWADFKIYDMQVFDRIAAANGAYRPLTCYPGAQDHCSLPNRCKSVLKRSHSCGASHVKIITETARGKPACEQRLPEDEDEVVADGYYRWMHQEYVSSLVDFGEFRVFLATSGGTDGVRVPYIVHVIRTNWNTSNLKNPRKVIGDRYHAVEVTPSDQWAEYPDLSYDKLTNFALHVYRQLQASGEAGFQSLIVGGRLDIGVSPDGREFFVNELTRWYGAHQFAMDTQDPPYDKICRAYAKAFGEMMGAVPRAVAVEGQNGGNFSRDEQIVEVRPDGCAVDAIVPGILSKRKADSPVDVSMRDAKGPKDNGYAFGFGWPS